MPRKKITATSKLREEKKLKKAIKRGDVDGPPADERSSRKKKPGARRTTQLKHDPTSANIDSARNLQSAFTKVSREFLAETKLLAASIPLPRPISVEAAILTPTQTGEADAKLSSRLNIPKRPKWRFDMTKKEVDSREESMFKTWLTGMDRVVTEWVDSANAKPQDTGPEELGFDKIKDEMPRSPTHFERNLEVWRQLWRVTEISQIILVLIDSRCPLLHFPPSLSTYLFSRPIILVLTKVDISGAERATAWTSYLNKLYPCIRVIQVEAYVEAEESTVHQGRTKLRPHVPETFRARLVQAIQEVHEEMLLPPKRIRAAVEAGTEQWKPPPDVKKTIDWDGVLKARGGSVGHAVGGAAQSRIDDEDDSEHINETHATPKEPHYLTIGLIGQPNVGKSSLLNALFGMQKVRASRTPGKV